MKTTKTFKIVMLPTGKAINDYSLVLLPRNKIQIMSPNDMIDYLDSQSDATKRQELYILSDDEIKKGDWVIMLDSFDNVFSHPQQYTDPNTQHLNKGLRKIVATTDILSFTNEKHELGKVTDYLPQIPESFVQAYIKAYNECKPITEVDLEMSKTIKENRPGSYEINLPIIEVLKTREDNTVIIHPSKTYTRDEVIKLINNYHESIVEYLDGYYQPYQPGIDKFIKDNL